MDTNRVGDLAESKVQTDLIENGYNVSIPLHDVEYDLIAEESGKFYRIQVKVATERNDRDSAQAQLKRSSRDTGNGDQRLYSENAFDVLAVWAKPYDGVAYTAWDEPKWSYTVRESDTNGRANIVSEETMAKATERLK